MQHDDTSLLSPDQVAALLQVERAWVIEAAYNGRLPALKLGRYWRFERAALERWLSDQRNGAYDRDLGGTNR